MAGFHYRFLCCFQSLRPEGNQLPLICSTVTMRNQEAEKCLEEELRRDKLSFPEHIRNGDLIDKMSRAINNLENELNLPVRSFDVD